MSKYQLMPPLSVDEYEKLSQDIRKNGVLVSVLEDESGNVLDGHNRVAICEELGLEYPPTEVVEGYTDAEKRELVYGLNLHRRHLNQVEKRKIIAAALKYQPDKSNRQHAENLGVDHKTVGDVRNQSESTGEIPQLNKTTGRDGKQRPATKPRSEPDGVTPKRSKRLPVGVDRGNEAINCLMRIPKNDSLRELGFQVVTDWIADNSDQHQSDEFDRGEASDRLCDRCPFIQRVGPLADQIP